MPGILCRFWGSNRAVRLTELSVFQAPFGFFFDSCQGDTNPYVTSHGCGLSTLKVGLIWLIFCWSPNKVMNFPFLSVFTKAVTHADCPMGAGYGFASRYPPCFSSPASGKPALLYCKLTFREADTPRFWERVWPVCFMCRQIRKQRHWDTCPVCLLFV